MPQTPAEAIAQAADVYGRCVSDLRRAAGDAADALYQEWLATDMSAIERDNRTSAIRAGLERAIEIEREWYRFVAHCPVQA